MPEVNLCSLSAVVTCLIWINWSLLPRLRTRKVRVWLFRGSWLLVVRIDTERIESNCKVPQTSWLSLGVFDVNDYVTALTMDTASSVSEVRLKFPKLRSCQLIRELWNEIVNFTPNCVGKFTPNFAAQEVNKFIAREVLVIRWDCVGIFWYVVVRLIRNWVVKRCNWIFPDVIRHLHVPKNRIQFLSRWFRNVWFSAVRFYYMCSTIQA